MDMNYTCEADDAYLAYLIKLVGGYGFEKPCEYFHTIPFQWYVPEDWNIESDAMTLRDRFQQDEKIQYSGNNPLCVSMMEVLVVISERMSLLLMDCDRVERSFFILLCNLGITEETSYSAILQIANTIVKRDYNEYGVGGFFPTRNYRIDPATTPLFDQLTLYCSQY